MHAQERKILLTNNNIMPCLKATLSPTPAIINVKMLSLFHLKMCHIMKKKCLKISCFKSYNMAIFLATAGIYSDPQQNLTINTTHCNSVFMY